MDVKAFFAAGVAWVIFLHFINRRELLRSQTVLPQTILIPGFLAFVLRASWLLGFLASWLLGFLAFGFLASRLLGFWAFRLFAGLCGFWWLFCFSHPLHSQFLFGRWRFGFCGFSLVYATFCGFGFSHPSGFLAFAPFHWFLDLASRIISITTTLFESLLLRTSWGTPPNPPATVQIVCRVIAPLFESTLLQTSWGGVAASPPLLFRFLAEIELRPCLNHLFFERPISRENAAKYEILVICVIHVCLYVCISSNIIGEATPDNPPTAF